MILHGKINQLTFNLQAVFTKNWPRCVSRTGSCGETGSGGRLGKLSPLYQAILDVLDVRVAHFERRVAVQASSF